MNGLEPNTLDSDTEETTSANRQSYIISYDSVALPSVSLHLPPFLLGETPKGSRFSIRNNTHKRVHIASGCGFVDGCLMREVVHDSFGLSLFEFVVCLDCMAGKRDSASQVRNLGDVFSCTLDGWKL